MPEFFGQPDLGTWDTPVALPQNGFPILEYDLDGADNEVPEFPTRDFNSHNSRSTEWDPDAATAHKNLHEETQLLSPRAPVTHVPISNGLTRSDTQSRLCPWEGSSGNSNDASDSSFRRLQPAMDATSPNLTVPSVSSHPYGTVAQYRCPESGCDTLAPFKRKPDFTRHMESQHGDRNKYVCPHDSCKRGRNGKGFARKGNLQAHI